MLGNYLLLAWRQLMKNKLYAAINVLGLTVGMAAYLFSTLLVNYERSHDLFFANAERIYTAGSVFGPAATIGVNETDGIYTAFGPFIDEEIEEVEEVARTVRREFLLSHEDDHFYQQIRFVDPAFMRIFDFQFIEGDATALQAPSGVIITAPIAAKYFGAESAMGKVFTLDHGETLHVAGVIEELPTNTHFGSSLMSEHAIEVVAGLQALNNADGYQLEGNWNNLSSGDYTYMLLAPDKDEAWLQQSLDGVYDRHFPQEGRDFISGMRVRPLVEANTMLWDAVGLPVLDSIAILGLLVLVVAIVNYTNLATAQSLGRSREIGLRKTMGASRAQLVTQFMVESICVAIVAMALALLLLMVLIPAFNTALSKAVELDWIAQLPWLILSALSVGIAAGAYPAYLITRTKPIDALRDGSKQGGKGGLFRSAMLVLQFSISIFMLAMVMVMYLQNAKVENSSEIYPKSQIITLQRLNVESIQQRLPTLRNELLKVPGVEAVTYSSQVPFEGSNSQFTVSRELGDEPASFLMSQILIDEQFLSAYDIPLLTGRDLDEAISGDTLRPDILSANVLVNELALRKLGFASAESALGEEFYDFSPDREARAYRIVGVIPDQNFQGFHNQIKPTAFYMVPSRYRTASVRVQGFGMADSMQAVEQVWERLIPDYPMQGEFLQDAFFEQFQIFTGLSSVLGGFAFIAMALSMIGLFGLAAFMAETRTKEIGVRKVMGASSAQIVRLLVWRFSRPVMWALLLALPLAYLASGQFLQFFAERITQTEGIILGAGCVAVVFSWLIVGVHALRVAQANPITALRYE